MLLDVDTPVFSMLLIQGGHLMFDRKDLHLQAERILITEGGSFQVLIVICTATSGRILNKTSSIPL